MGKAVRRQRWGHGSAGPAQVHADARRLFFETSPVHLPIIHTWWETSGKLERGQKHKSRSNISEGEIINCNLIT